MDSERFDAVIRMLGAGATRRGALGLLAGAAGLALGEVAARKSKKRRGGVRAQGAKEDKPAKAGKVTICHATSSETNPYEVITISENGWVNGHADHEGDSLRGNCCGDDDCEEPEDRCFVSQCRVVGEGTERKSKCAEVIKPECDCTQWVLSGGPNASDPIGVDDDLRVELNGATIFNDSNGSASNIPPIAFASEVGDSLRVVARDRQRPCRSLSPLWLHCPASGLSRKLFDGVEDPEPCANTPVPADFVDETFTVEL